MWMICSNWVLGDYDGNLFVEIRERGWSKEIVTQCGYVLLNGVKFVNEREVHDERIRRIAEQEDGR